MSDPRGDAPESTTRVAYRVDMVVVVRGQQAAGGTRDSRARKQLRSIAATLAIGAASVALAACGGSSKGNAPNSHVSYATLLGAGVQLVKQGNLEAAGQLFQEAIARKPQGAVGYYDLGVVYQQEGNAKQATSEYYLAIHYNRNYVPALYNQAGILARSEPAVAMFYYRRIIRVQPDSPTTLLHLGLLELATVNSPGPSPLPQALHPRSGRSPAARARARARARAQALRALALAVKLDPSLRADVPAQLRASLPAIHKK